MQSNESFAELGASAPTQAALARRGITHPFPIQQLVIADAIAGRDVLGKSQTGSGKTLAFAIPMVETLDPSAKRPSGLVLVPTRELAQQVRDEFNIISTAKSLRVAAVYGGSDLRDQARKAAKAHIIIATPGRLQDLIERRLIDVANVSILILDEADRMLDMGFQPQVDRIVKRIPKQRQTMFFSATLDGEVGRLASAYTKAPVLHELNGVRPTVEEVEHRFLPVDEMNKLNVLVELMNEERGLALVFVRTKRGADRLARKLAAAGVRAEAMHGDMSQAARERSLKRFDSGTSTILVATDVAARGLDVDGITHVVNYDPPEDHKAYLHRVGRTARAGRGGVGITFVRPADRVDVSRVASALQLKAEFEDAGLKVAAPQVAYASHRGRRSMMGRRPRRR